MCTGKLIVSDLLAKELLKRQAERYVPSVDPVSIAEQARTRRTEILNYPTPTVYSLFETRLDECISELRRIASDVKANDIRDSLDDLGEASKLINGAIEKYKKQPPPPEPEDPWWRKVLKQIVALCKAIIEIAKKLVSYIVALGKAVCEYVWNAVVSAWESFFLKFNEDIIRCYLNAYIGLPCSKCGTSYTKCYLT